MESVLRKLDDVRAEIQDGDWCLLRRPSIIARVGRGIHSHAGKALWWDSDLFLAEFREWKGGRVVLLDSQVQRHPGRIDIYQTNYASHYPDYNRQRASRFMRRLAGREYNYRGIALAALRHLPLVRLVIKPQLTDTGPSLSYFCSQAVATAERVGGGIDVVPNLADSLCEPADLARSLFARYKFTLVP